MKTRLLLWLVLALFLGALPAEVGAQQPKDSVLRIPPDAELRATLANQTAKVKVQAYPSPPSRSMVPAVLTARTERLDWRYYKAVPGHGVPPAQQQWFGGNLGQIATLRLRTADIPPPTAAGSGWKLVFDDPAVRYAGRAIKVADEANGVMVTHVDVALARNVNPGPKAFTLNGAAGTWPLDFPEPDPDAKIMVQTKPTTARQETNVLEPGQRFHVEYRFSHEPFYTFRLARLDVNTAEGIPFALAMPAGSRNVLRSQEFVVGESDQASPVFASPGDLIRVRAADRTPPDEWYHLDAATYRVLTRREKPYRDLGEAYIAPSSREERLVVHAPSDLHGLAQLPALVKEQEFHITVTLTLARAATVGPTMPVEMKVDETGSSRSLELTRAARGGRYTLWRPLRLADFFALRYDDGHTVRFSYGALSAQVLAYETSVAAELASYRQRFAALHDYYGDWLAKIDRIVPMARALAEEFDEHVPAINVDNDRRLLQLRRQYVGNALSFMSRADFTPATQLVFARWYYTPVETGSWEFWGWTGPGRPSGGIQLAAVEEAEIIMKAFAQAREERTGRWVRFAAGATQATYGVVLSHPILSLVKWIPLIEGITADGRRATIHDKVLAGCEIVLVLAPIAKSVVKAQQRYQKAFAPPPRTPADRILPAARAAEEQFARRALERLGLDPAARNRIDYARLMDRHGLDGKAIVAGQAFTRKIPADRVRAELGISAEQHAALLDRYLERLAPGASGRTRGDILARYLGADGAAALRSVREAKAVALLGEAGVMPPQARLALETGGVAGRIPEEQALFAAYHADAPAERLLRRTGVDRAEARQMLDDHLRARGMTDGAARAREVDRYFSGQPRADRRPGAIFDPSESRVVRAGEDTAGPRRPGASGVVADAERTAKIDPPPRSPVDRDAPTGIDSKTIADPADTTKITGAPGRTATPASPPAPAAPRRPPPPDLVWAENDALQDLANYHPGAQARLEMVGFNQRGFERMTDAQHTTAVRSVEHMKAAGVKVHDALDWAALHAPSGVSAAQLAAEAIAFRGTRAVSIDEFRRLVDLPYGAARATLEAAAARFGKRVDPDGVLRLVAPN